MGISGRNEGVRDLKRQSTGTFRAVELLYEIPQCQVCPDNGRIQHSNEMCKQALKDRYATTQHQSPEIKDKVPEIKRVGSRRKGQR